MFLKHWSASDILNTDHYFKNDGTTSNSNSQYGSVGAGFGPNGSVNLSSSNVTVGNKSAPYLSAGGSFGGGGGASVSVGSQKSTIQWSFDPLPFLRK